MARATLANFMSLVAAALLLPLLLVLECFAATAGKPAATPLRLHEAQAIIQPDGQDAVQRTVDLPYHWDRIHKGRTGMAEFELHFGASTGRHEMPWGLYVPRIGNTAEIRLNGTLIATLGDLTQPGTEDHAKGPRYFTLPPVLLSEDNTLHIRVRADSGRRGGLSQLVVGKQDDVRPLYESAYRRRVLSSVAIYVFSLMTGCMALMLWGVQLRSSGERRDPVYLAAAMALLCWVLRITIGDILGADPPLPWTIWGVLSTMTLASWACCSVWFMHCLAGWRKHRLTPWLQTILWLTLASSAVAAALSFTMERTVWLTLWHGALNLALSMYMLVYLVLALRWPREPMRLMGGLAGGANIVASLHDLMVRAAGELDSTSWVRWASVLLGLTVAVIVMLRFRRDSSHIRDLTGSLSERVAQKERELADNYAQLEQLARAQAAADERARILRDMHDGVGANLSAAIRQLQSGSSDHEEVLRTLRDSLDQLKLSIDAMHLEPGDVTTLLANLRYRLEPRLNGAGIQLHWEVEELPLVLRLDTHAMRQLQFMLFEVISNVLQHAQANELSITAKATNDGKVQLVLADNGHGFDENRPPRTGLLSLRERAQAIAAGLKFRSSDKGTEVEISLAP